MGPGLGRTANPFQGAGANIGEGVASALKIPGAVGRYAGGGLHWLLKKITGFGDYKVSSNSLVLKGKVPAVFASDGRGTMIQHREYIGDVVGSTAFAVRAYPINAGMQDTFPWLSQIAANYEQYCVRGMIFEFKSTSANALNSTNTALGTVVMSTQYNSVNANFASKAQMENHEFSTSGKPSESFMHPIECARGETPISCLYTRVGTVPSGQDARLYDLGVMNIATVGMQAAAVIGELHVIYDIELLKPRLFDSLGDDILMDKFNLPTTASATNYFGSTVPSATAKSNLGCVLTTANTGTITFPNTGVNRVYNLQYQVTGASTALTNPLSFTVAGGATSTTLFYRGGTQPTFRQTAGATDTVQFICAIIEVAANSSAATFVFAGGTLPGTVTDGDLAIMEFNELAISLEKKNPVVIRNKAFVPESLHEETKCQVEEIDDEEEEYLRWKYHQMQSRSRDESKRHIEIPLQVSEPSPKVMSKK